MVSLQDLNEGMTDCEAFLIVCPICRGELELANPYRRHGRVRTGELRCSKGCATFPIIYGIPVILPPGQPARWILPRWVMFLRQHGREKLMEALDAGEFDKQTKETGPPVSEEEIKQIRRTMSNAGWQRYLLKRVKTSSSDSNVIVIVERLREIESGVLLEIGCGGGFTTERVLQEIQPSV